MECRGVGQLKYDATGKLKFERGDRVWCWFHSEGPPTKGTILHKYPSRAHYEDRYGVWLDQPCAWENQRLVKRAAWLIWSVFDSEIMRDYPLDALAET
jgi:hypothetical protein